MSTKHLKLHSLTGNTDHDVTGLVAGQIVYIQDSVNGVQSTGLNTNGSGGLSATTLYTSTLSADTIYSAGTPLDQIFASVYNSGGTSGNLWSSSTGAYSIIANNGTGNLAEAYYSFVVGNKNRASGENSAVVGGQYNIARDVFSAVIGGKNNYSSNNYSVIAGGYGNYIGSSNSFIGGGRANSATTNYATVIGGQYNRAYGYYSSIIGGKQNITSGYFSGVIGGSGNTAVNYYSVVVGGSSNTASGIASVIIGGQGITGSSDNTVYIPNARLAETSGTVVYSAGTDLYDIFQQAGTNVNTAVQPGSNITTGGTASTPIINLTDSPSVNGLSVSGTGNFTGTLQSGGTDLANIFIQGSGTSGTLPVWNGSQLLGDSLLTQAGTGVTVNGSVQIYGDVNILGTATTFNTTTVQTSDNNITMNLSGSHVSALYGGITILSGRPDNTSSTWTIDANGTWSANTGIYASAITINGGAIISGSTDLYDIFTSASLFSASTGSNSIIANNGSGNIANASFATAIGRTNTASGTYSLVVGRNNTASGSYSSIVGGHNNTAGGQIAHVGGGKNHTASGNYATIGGGQYNTATSNNATVGGGSTNTAQGNSATIAGGLSNNVAAGTYFSTIGGGRGNTVTGNRSVIAGGYNNTISSNYATIAGGQVNTVSAFNASVLGGRNNLASERYSSIVGGSGNTVSGRFSSILGGSGNTASGVNTIIIGGKNINGTADDTVYTQNARLAETTGTKIYSAGTDLYNIFGTAGSGVQTVSPGSNITTGGTVTNPIISLTSSPSVNGLSVSGTGNFTGTLQSGGTDLYNVFAGQGLVVTDVQAGANINIGGTSTSPIVNLVDSPSVNGLSVSGTGNFTGALQSGGTDLANIFTQGSGTSGTLPVWNGSQLLGDSLLTQGLTGVTVNGSVQIYGDVNILGTATTFNTTTVQTSDNNITMNLSGSHVSALYGGITVLSGRPDNTSSTWTIDANGAWSANTGIYASAITINGGAIVSGSTNLYNIFAQPSQVVNNVNAGSNITTGGTAISPTINLAASPSVNNFTASGNTMLQGTTGTTIYASQFFSMTPYTGSNPTVTLDDQIWFHSGATGVITLNYKVGGAVKSVELS